MLSRKSSQILIWYIKTCKNVWNMGFKLWYVFIFKGLDRSYTEDADFLLCVIIGQGMNGCFKAQDDEDVSIDEVIHIFNTENCIGLRDKPKIFIIQVWNRKNVLMEWNHWRLPTNTKHLCEINILICLSSSLSSIESKHKMSKHSKISIQFRPKITKKEIKSSDLDIATRFLFRDKFTHKK